MKILARNKIAQFDYEILEKYEAGIVLTGAEVKSVKLGNINLKGGYITIHQEEAWLINVHIAPYIKAGKKERYEAEKPRKLLLHRKELNSLIGKLKQKGLTLVPLSIYTKRGKIKVEFGLCRGKRKYEKRERIKQKEAERKIQRGLRKKL